MAKTMHHLDLLKTTFLKSPRVQAYCAIILVCSVLPLSDIYKIHKHNILNQWFVKLGWFWTLIALLPMQFVTTKPQDKEAVFHSVMRTILSSIFWYISVNLFELIDDYIGFDISGHTFLLGFSNLLLSSELNLLKIYIEKNKQKQQQNSNSLTKHLSNLKAFTLVLMILWDFMLLQTALYYHTLIQKVVAILWAIGSWTVLDILFYQDSRMLPVGASSIGFGNR